MLRRQLGEDELESGYGIEHRQDRLLLLGRQWHLASDDFGDAPRIVKLPERRPHRGRLDVAAGGIGLERRDSPFDKLGCALYRPFVDRLDFRFELPGLAREIPDSH